jgi:hypothetical protein
MYMDPEKMIPLKNRKYLKTDHGPVAFGYVTSMAVVSWSDRCMLDLLFYRLGDSYYLYPSRDLDDCEFSKDPLKAGMPENIYMRYEEVSVPADWNRDGTQDLIAAGMTGYVYYLERKGRLPEISFVNAGPLTDEDKNLIFNIPYDNPQHPVMNDLNGYFDTEFFNYPCPITYPMDDTDRINLIIGDWAGNLWWLRDHGDGKGRPVYRGERYIKSAGGIVSKTGKYLIEKYGCEYVKPEKKICDENAEPFRLGDGYDSGFEFIGGVTRPSLYFNKTTGMYDLLVMAGTRSQSVYYLQRINDGKEDRPSFKNLGMISIDGLQDPYKYFGFHSRISVFNSNGQNDLLITSNQRSMGVFRNSNANGAMPGFVFERWISGDDITAWGSNFTEILTDISGRRYLLDNPTTLELREIKKNGQDMRISSDKISIRDQFGIFKPEGETDPQLGKDWGFNRAARWDFDGSGRQHLIVGTDKGYLYLLIEEQKLGTDGEFIYRSAGPLKDTDGDVIKLHNRACAAGVDLDGDGREDLIAGGVTYQLGSETDPCPGGGFYYLHNAGTDKDGIPMLEKARVLRIDGHAFEIKVNTHVHIKALDRNEGGEKQIVIAVQSDDFKARIFGKIPGETGLVYTGRMIERMSIEQNLLDIDGDGHPEMVFGGGEEGAAYYYDQLPIL